MKEQPHQSAVKMEQLYRALHVKTESDLCVPDRKQSGSVPSAFPAVSLTTPQSHLVPQLYHRTAWGMSSLKTSSYWLCPCLQLLY